MAVHTTQFAIRNPEHALLEPVLRLAAEELGAADQRRDTPMVRIGGVCGQTSQAVDEAELLLECGYHAALVSLSAFTHAPVDALVDHCRALGNLLPIIGFYLQPAVGGRLLPYAFWRRLAEIDSVVAIKIAPFNRYQTLDVIRAVADSGRDDLALYTGNDDNIIVDLVTPFRLNGTERHIVGGLLGQWAVWTSKAVELLEECRAVVASGGHVPLGLMRRAAQLTDANAAIFDAAHEFAGCIAGVHEVLRRQGLLEGTWCLDPHERLSEGQAAEIDRVCNA